MRSVTKKLALIVDGVNEARVLCDCFDSACHEVARLIYKPSWNRTNDKKAEWSAGSSPPMKVESRSAGVNGALPEVRDSLAGKDHL